ncbi:MAG: hypothetical protein ACI4DZ_04185 [Oliverpabstia sp.]
MILAVILTLSSENYFTEDRIDWIAVVIGILMLFLIQKKKWSVPKVIGCSAILGIVGYSIQAMVI